MQVQNDNGCSWINDLNPKTNIKSLFSNAVKRNTTLWFDDNFVGTELDPELSYAKVADACGLKGVTVRTMEETTNAIKQSCEDQKKGITTFIEVILNQELGEPFRRDAIKKPVKVAGINNKDMRKQPSLIS